MRWIAYLGTPSPEEQQRLVNLLTGDRDLGDGGVAPPGGDFPRERRVVGRDGVLVLSA